MLRYECEVLNYMEEVDVDGVGKVVTDCNLPDSMGCRGCGEHKGFSSDGNVSAKISIESVRADFRVVIGDCRKTQSSFRLL